MVILMQLFPEKAAAIEKAAIVGGGLYFLAWAALRFLAQHNRRRAEAAQSAADEAEYQDSNGNSTSFAQHTIRLVI